MKPTVHPEKQYTFSLNLAARSIMKVMASFSGCSWGRLIYILSSLVSSVFFRVRSESTHSERILRACANSEYRTSTGIILCCTGNSHTYRFWFLIFMSQKKNQFPGSTLKMQLHIAIIAIDYGCEKGRSVWDRLYSFALVMFIGTSKKQGPFLLATLAADIYCYG